MQANPDYWVEVKGNNYLHEEKDGLKSLNLKLLSWLFLFGLSG